METFIVELQIKLAQGRPDFLPAVISRGLSQRLNESVKIIDYKKIEDEPIDLMKKGPTVKFSEVAIGDIFFDTPGVEDYMIKVSETEAHQYDSGDKNWIHLGSQKVADGVYFIRQPFERDEEVEYVPFVGEYHV
jgi:hypothetical protein